MCWLCLFTEVKAGLKCEGHHCPIVTSRVGLGECKTSACAGMKGVQVSMGWRVKGQCRHGEVKQLERHEGTTTRGDRK